MLRLKPYNLLVILLATAWLLIQGCSDGSQPENIAKEIAPDFDLTLFDGGTFKLSDQKGKRPVVINFFASWCVSCGKETPVIEAMYKQYGPDRVAFLGIAVDDTEKKAKQFMKKHGLNIPAGLDRAGEIKDAFGLYGMPTTFFIDKEGLVSYFHSGVVTERLMKHEIEKIL